MAIKAAAVRASMAHALEKALGTEVQVATAPDQLTPPCLLLGMPALEYNATFNGRPTTSSSRRGLDAAELPVWLILPRVHDQAAVDTADELISGTGARSIVEILQADPTLGGACQALAVPRADPEVYPAPQGDLPAYRWTVEIWA